MGGSRLTSPLAADESVGKITPLAVATAPLYLLKHTQTEPMGYPPPNPHKIARVLKKDCGVKGGIKYAESIIRGSDSPQYRTAYRKARRILTKEPDTV